MLQRNTLYFNETFADPVFRTGRVTLYEPPLPSGFGGVYEGAGGYGAFAENVGYNAESCDTAAMNVDPVAST